MSERRYKGNMIAVGVRVPDHDGQRFEGGVRTGYVGGESVAVPMATVRYGDEVPQREKKFSRVQTLSWIASAVERISKDPSVVTEPDFRQEGEVALGEAGSILEDLAEPVTPEEIDVIGAFAVAMISERDPVNLLERPIDRYADGYYRAVAKELDGPVEIDPVTGIQRGDDGREVYPALVELVLTTPAEGSIVEA